MHFHKIIIFVAAINYEIFLPRKFPDLQYFKSDSPCLTESSTCDTPDNYVKNNVLLIKVNVNLNLVLGLYLSVFIMLITADLSISLSCCIAIFVSHSCRV